MGHGSKHMSSSNGSSNKGFDLSHACARYMSSSKGSSNKGSDLSHAGARYMSSSNGTSNEGFDWSHAGERYGDSLQALSALKLFLPVASPAAAQTVQHFLLARHELQDKGPTLDTLLLDALRAPHVDQEEAFVAEWRSFARGAQVKDRSNVSKRAWAQWHAFGGEADRALPLPAFEVEGAFLGCLPQDEVEESGVVRLNACLGRPQCVTLRSYVLAQRDSASEACFSRVLCPKNGDSQETTRWDLRLPWNAIVQSVVRELMASPLGGAFHALAGGDEAELFECAAVISARGSAPQILHSDTVFSEEAQLYTAFVALQDITIEQGPTRFIMDTHSGAFGSHSHDELEHDGLRFCEGATSVVALLRAGDCTLYDSRLLHCGGAFLQKATHGPGTLASAAPIVAERVLFYVSVRHAAASPSLSNADLHGPGSILPALAEQKLRLGQLLR